MKKYPVVWKDKVLDELSRDEIAAAFERGTYGILHCVRLEKGKLTDLKTFLSDKNFEEAEKETSAEEENFKAFDFQTFAYLLCGFSFIFWRLSFLILIYCFFLHLSGRKTLAAISLLLGAFMALAGYIFFQIVYPVL